MQPRDYLPILRKRWPLVVGIVAVAIVASYLFTRLQTPVYRATVWLTVKPARPDYGNVLVIENSLRQFARELQTDKLAQTVDDRLKLDLPVDRLLGQAHISAVSEDLLLEIQIDDVDANRARDIAFVWADEYTKNHQNQQASIDPHDRIEVDLLDKPKPAVLNWPKRTQIMAAAAVLAVLAGLVLAFLLEFLDDTLKSAEDVDRYVGGPLLAAIPNAETVVGRVGGRNGHTKTKPPVVGARG